jgi:iron complex outermembrane recepter protein
MERRSISGGQQFNIRGYGNGARGTNGVSSNFDGQGYKVYLNGIPVTDAEGITVMDDLDFGSVGNVEIVKGPAGTLYGLAIAGAVNLHTLMPERGKSSIGQDVMLGSYGLARYTTHVALGMERSSLLVNYGHQDFDGYMVHTASHKDFVNLMGEFKPNDRQSIFAYIGYSNSYDERNGEMTLGQYDTLNYSGNLNYINNNAHSNVISFRAGLSHTYRFNEKVSNTTSLFGTAAPSNASSAGGWTDKNPLNYGFRTTVDMNFPLGERYKLTGLAGAEAQQQVSQTIAYAMVVDSANPGGYRIIGNPRSNVVTKSSTYTLFTEWTLSMPYDISVTAGVGVSSMAIRLDDHYYVAANNIPNRRIPTTYEKSYNGLVSPHFAINKVFSKMLSVYASYSTGYKAPVSSYFYIPTTGQLNLGLKPEKGTQYEIGTKGALLKGRLIYQVAVFDAIFSDKMTAIAVPLNSTTTNYSYVANGGTQNDIGIEALLKYSVYESEAGFFRSIGTFANFTYSMFEYENFKFQRFSNPTTVVEVDYSGKAVAGVPPITVNCGFDIFTKMGLYMNATYSYRDPMPITSDNTLKTSAFSLVNAKIGYSRVFADHYGVDAFFGANNITGTQYYYMVFLNQLPDAYIPAPYEINYFGGINLKYIF